jgi:hypothetical protein
MAWCLVKLRNNFNFTFTWDGNVKMYFRSDRFLEQRINIKFCVKLGKNANDTCAALSKVYGEDAMKKSNVFD